MLVTTVTTIVFNIPEEYDLEQSFRLNNDTREWKKNEDSGHVYYTRTQHSTTTVSRKGEQ